MTDRPGKVIIIGDVLFPFGDAAANRIFAIAKALKESGYQLTVISRGKPRQEDKQEDDCYKIDNIAYYPYTGLPAKTVLGRLHRPVSAIIHENESGEKISAVILYASTSYVFAPGIIRYCKKHKVPLAADVVEWYEPSQYPRGRLDWHYLLFSLGFRFYFPKIKQLIVISRVLERYFQSRECSTERIPGLIDCAAIPCSDTAEGGKLHLLYAGVPGRKDLVAQAILGLLLLSDEELSRVEFNLLGPDEAQLARLVGGELPTRLNNVVRAYGRVPLEQVSERLLQSDFTVLLREDRRVTNAGFPSKVPESLAHGVPILANMTSDMALYLNDGRECITVDGCMAGDFAAALKRALLLSAAELSAMKRAARLCAQNHFDYRVYAQQLCRVVEGAGAAAMGQR